MKKSLNLFVMFLGMALVFGCATRQTDKIADEKTVMKNALPVKASTVAENDPHKSAKVIKKAKSAIGTPYVYGGSAPGGFDCSGLVKWAYSSVGVELPRTAREQSVVGDKIKKVEDMRAGDIVAFRHPKRGYHTGIYVGDGKFVHSPRKRSRVRINSLDDPYFSKTLLGARRINISSGQSLVAEAEKRLEEYLFQKSKVTVANTRKNVKTTAASTKTTAQKATKAATAKKTKTVAKNAAKAKTTASSKTTAKSKKSVNKPAAAKSKTVAAKNTKKAATAKSQQANKKMTAQAAKKSTNNKKSAVKATSKTRTVAASSKAKISNSKKSANKEVSLLQRKKAKAVSRRHS